MNLVSSEVRKQQRYSSFQLIWISPDYISEMCEQKITNPSTHSLMFDLINDQNFNLNAIRFLFDNLFSFITNMAVNQMPNEIFISY